MEGEDGLLCLIYQGLAQLPKSGVSIKSITFDNKIVHAHLLSCVQIFVTPWTIAHQVLLCTEFLSQEYWSGCHFLLQGIFLTQR